MNPSSDFLQDPEAEDSEIYDEPIIAVSLEEATKICQQKANSDGSQVVKVQAPSRLRSGRNQQYRCWFKA